MFKFFTFATLAVSAVSTVYGAAIPAERRDEASYDQAFLEPYADYNARYNALSCATQHGTQFFDDCCHPLLIGQTLADNRKAYCNPWTASASSSVAASTAPASSAVNNVAPAPTSFSTTSSATPTKAATTSSKTQTPTTTAAASGPTNTGHATWFLQHNTAGACGTVHQDSDFVIALDSAVYDNGAHCGKTVKLTNLDSGATTTAIVADECPTCDSDKSIDLSKGAFGALTNSNFDLGEFNIGWEYA